MEIQISTNHSQGRYPLSYNPLQRSGLPGSINLSMNKNKHVQLIPMTRQPSRVHFHFVPNTILLIHRNFRRYGSSIPDSAYQICNFLVSAPVSISLPTEVDMTWWVLHTPLLSKVYLPAPISVIIEDFSIGAPSLLLDTVQ